VGNPPKGLLKCGQIYKMYRILGDVAGNISAGDPTDLVGENIVVRLPTRTRLNPGLSI